MKLALTLDYELFLGTRTGDVQRCLIDPLNLYLEHTKTYGVRFTIFVDASYIYMLRKYGESYPALRDDYDTISRHLVGLQNEGHDIQLHIHPQWFFSHYDGRVWSLDNEHYKLCDVDEDTMLRLFVDSKNLLDRIIGKKTIAFRAGGFSAQPTSLLVRLFRETGICADSSVCPGAFYDSPCQKYDYTNAPDMVYRFESDICTPDNHGAFTEIPVSMHRVSPLFHWRLAATKLWSMFFHSSTHKTLGNGVSIASSRNSVFERLFSRVYTMSTIDGYKITFLQSSIDEHLSRNSESMCVLGHPKLATPYSINRIASVCDYAAKRGVQFVTISEML